MRKTIILCSILFLALTAKSQVIVDGVDINKLDSVKYCEILGVEAGMFQKKLQVVIDYGQKFKWGTDARIQDSTGKVMIFNTMVSPLNFMSANGWEFVATYSVSYTGGSSIYHTLLRKKE